MLNEKIVFEHIDRKVISEENKFKIQTIEGDMLCNVGDYIIIGVDNEIYPCNKEIFEKTYEVVK